MSSKLKRNRSGDSDAALLAIRRNMRVLIMFSVATNLLILFVPLHMMQVYGRVLVSQSQETLLYLTGITIVALLVWAACEYVRSAAG